MSWPTTADGLWYLFEGEIRIPIDPSTGVAVIHLRPQGGMGVGIPAIADGQPGAPATFQTGAQAFTELDPDDPTPASLTVTEVSPGVYAITGALHGGAKGDDGTTSISMGSIGGTAAAGKLIRVNSGATGFDYGYERLNAVQWPATISNTSAGNSNSTVATVSIAARNTDYRVRARGYQIVRQSGGADVIVNLYARLNGETGGNIISKCQGLGGTERLTLVDAPPAGSVDAFNKVTAGNTATVHFRAEQQSGANSYTTSNSEALFVVDILAI